IAASGAASGAGGPSTGASGSVGGAGVRVPISSALHALDAGPVPNASTPSDFNDTPDSLPPVQIVAAFENAEPTDSQIFVHPASPAPPAIALAPSEQLSIRPAIDDLRDTGDIDLPRVLMARVAPMTPAEDNEDTGKAPVPLSMDLQDTGRIPAPLPSLAPPEN